MDPAADSFVVGVGGGSRIRAVVVDRDGRERGRATAGSSNNTVVGGDGRRRR
jgi:hypothetical protein